MKKTLIGIPLVFVLFNIVAYLTGCTEELTDAKLERLRQEAIAQNTAKVSLHQKNQTKSDWPFVVQGQTSKGKPIQLSLAQLESLATTSVWTKEPHNTKNPNSTFHFRGVAVSKLLDKFGVAPDVTEVTFIAHDGYRVTVNLGDLRHYPIIIALERDNRKISRSDGGPLYLVFPYNQYPQLQQQYPDRYWAFYLTDMVVGTEPIHLKVGKRVFNTAALEKLPPVRVEETVGYRIGWPVGKVKLYGVRMQDVLAAAGLTLPQGSAIILRGKSPIYQNPAKPILLEASDIQRCNILLATHWGNDRQPIPAKMGGPVTLALSSACKTQSDAWRWMTFVEELEVTETGLGKTSSSSISP